MATARAPDDQSSSSEGESGKGDFESQGNSSESGSSSSSPTVSLRRASNPSITDCLGVPLSKDREGFKRRARTLTFRRKKTDKSKDLNKKHSKRFWTFRLRKRLPGSGRLRKGKDHGLPDPHPGVDDGTCVCTGYRRTEDHVLGPGIVFNTAGTVPSLNASNMSSAAGSSPNASVVGIPLTNGNLLQQMVPPPPQDTATFPHTNLGLPRAVVGLYPADLVELKKFRRAVDMEQGVEISDSEASEMNKEAAASTAGSSVVHPSSNERIWKLTTALQNQCILSSQANAVSPEDGSSSQESQIGEYREYPGLGASYIPRTFHTQVDYIHCLVPDLLKITHCSYYWGVMDRYEAEKLLENKPEGTFLLRDSAQEEFLFSVSFRRYGRSLHARIEQWNHKFSFDSHDPGVYASDTVCGLIEHYKDPSCCMFFEPMLTLPLHRSFPFSLQHMCRSAICSNSTYDGMNFLPLPKALRQYLKYYHYKQKVRVRRFECLH